MNLALLSPFRKSSPDRIEATLLHPHLNPSSLSPATSLSFNRRGSYLAAGYADGSLVIWDFLSRSVVRHMEDVHVSDILTINWSRRGRFIMTSGSDGFICTLDLTIKTPKIKRFNVVDTYLNNLKGSSSDLNEDCGGKSPCSNPSSSSSSSSQTKASQNPHSVSIVHCMLKPRTTTLAIVVLSTGVLCLVNLPTDTAPFQINILSKPEGKQAPISSPSSDTKKRPKQSKALNFTTSATFDKAGHNIYATTHTGFISIFTAPLFTLFRTLRISGSASPLKSIRFSPDGHSLLVNSSDSTLRLLPTPIYPFTTTILKPTYSYTDIINRTKFSNCAFSHNGEHCLALTSTPWSHSIYIYDTTSTSLIEILKGPQVKVCCFDYHPVRSHFCTGLGDGSVSVWGLPINWEALAPDFQSLPRNVEYVEREDEFDIVPGSKGVVEEDVEEEGREVDVVGIEKLMVFESDSEEEGEVFFFKAEVLNGRDEEEDEDEGGGEERE